MRMSESFGRTLREAPAAYDPSTAFALRAALIRFVNQRIAFLPLGLRIANNIMNELLPEGTELDFVGLPHDVNFEDLIRLFEAEIQSYRQFPLQLASRSSIVHSSVPRGLARPDRVTGIRWVSATISQASQNELCELWLDQMETKLDSLGIAPQRTQRLENGIGWVKICDFGPEPLLACPACSYLAFQEGARFKRNEFLQETLLPLEIVSTPGADTIEKLSDFLDISSSKTLKAMFLVSENGCLVLALIRGDLEISLSKLKRVLKVETLVPASHETIGEIGAVPGYASPIGICVQHEQESAGTLVVADFSIELGMNFVSGANKPGFHFTGVNYPRDFEVTLIADIAMPRVGDRCPQCSEPLELRSGIDLGFWENLGQKIHYTDKNGKMAQGFLSIGTLYLEPIFAALIDVFHHEGVMNWPARLAPYDVYLVDLRSPQETNEVYELLTQEGLSVLSDDRRVSPGIKFTDADLIGCFFRVTVSKRNLERGGVELLCRADRKQVIVPIEAIAPEAAALKSKFM